MKWRNWVTKNHIFPVHHFLQFYAIFRDLHFENGVGDVIYPQVAIVKGAAT